MNKSRSQISSETPSGLEGVQDNLFQNVPDDVQPRKELFPGVYLIYHVLTHADPVVSTKGLFDTIDGKKIAFTENRLKDLYAKHKPWPLNDVALKNMAEAIGEGPIVESMESLPNIISDEIKKTVEPLKIERNDNSIKLTFFVLWTSNVFPGQLRPDEQRPYNLKKFILHFSKKDLTISKELIASHIDGPGMAPSAAKKIPISPAPAQREDPNPLKKNPKD